MSEEPSGAAASRKLPASLDASSSIPRSSKRKFVPMDEAPFEFEESPCDAATIKVPPTLQEGNVIVIPRTEGQHTFDIPLYIRQHLVDKFHEVTEEFEKTRLLHAYVTGAPGCGKTCFFWMWAFAKVQENKRVLFIQYRTVPIIWILEHNLLKRVTSPRVEKDNLMALVQQLLQQQTKKFDFAILDGVWTTEETCKYLISKLKSTTGNRESAKISKVILVTSLQFSYPGGFVNRGRFNEGVDISFDSWNETEYGGAAESSLVIEDPFIRNLLLNDWKVLTSTNDESQTIDDSVVKKRIQEAVKLKYLYAGGCARFMFEVNFVEVKAALDGSLANLSRADWEVLVCNAVSSRAATCVTTLMQRFSGGRLFYCTPVSEYVLWRAYEVCRSKLTNAVRAAAGKTNNPSLSGWAFEMVELDKIDEARNENVAPHHANRWAAIQLDIITPKQDAKHVISFCPQFFAKFDGKQIEGKRVLESGTVIWCDIWNQGCFDIAVYFGTTLLTLQVTRAKSHSLKLKYIADLRNALKAKNAIVDEVVHVGILDDSNSEFFRSDQAEGKHQRTRSEPEPDYCVKVVMSRVLQTNVVTKEALSICRLDYDDNVGITVYDMHEK